MKSKLAHSAFVIASLLALTHFAAAQGTSGSTGAIASIPSSVVRAGEQGQAVTQPGLFSIITSSTPPGADAGSKQETIRRGQHPRPSK
ncbi:MAG TPA: hypothetical protein VNO32_34320 [Candidatus Acidoferrum sp.]|jgi:hypothetical protein|nr:hypothetical protein [Candidatus Acidoferrum sp.]